MSYLYGPAKPLKEVKIPKKILDILRQLSYESSFVETYFILGEEMLSALIDDMKYYPAVDLMMPDEVAALKQEVLSGLEHIEMITKKAYFPRTGKEVHVYISNAYFDGNYGYMQGTNFQLSSIYLYGINQMNSTDSDICKTQKAWIQSLIAYSTLISGSGRLQGTEFFSRQRELINTI